MAFSVQAIRYGWVALASLGVITGTTIYVANNQRHQVKPQDFIEVALGTDERAMATQTGTNSDGTPIYAVARPSFVRTWTSNVYTTNGVTVYTNIVTNTIGWYIDRAMMVSLDTTIKALVPYYVDTNTVYDGTINIVMLTVTGLWASLGIGDRTNKFTREPAWTNSISTNWIVNYTSYWPSTNGMATNIVYTSDYRQVVNYAQSWTATGGHVWVTSSNWASEVVTVTNAATYGDYPWQIYVEDLQERYKVLNALKMVKLTSFSTVNSGKGGQRNFAYYDSSNTWDQAKGWVETNINEGDYSESSTRGIFIYVYDGVPVYYQAGFYASKSIWTNTIVSCSVISPFDGTIEYWMCLTNNAFTNSYTFSGWARHFIFDQVAPYDANGTPNIINGTYYKWISTVVASNEEYQASRTVSFDAAWCAEPSDLTGHGAYRSATWNSWRGFQKKDSILLRNLQFNYCTNKYW